MSFSNRLPRRILLLENYRQTIAVARSLNLAGCEVYAGMAESANSSFDRAVAACAAVTGLWNHPDFSSDRFPAAVRDYCRNQGIAAIFPVGEVSLPVLDRVSGLPPIVAPRLETSLLCLDKARAGEIARASGLPLPLSREVSTLSGLREAVEAIGAPLVIKSADGLKELLGRKAWIFTKEAPPDAARLEEMTEFPVLVQEFINGSRHNCMFLAVDGRLTAYFEEKVRRTDEADGTGISTAQRSVAPTPELKQHVADLVRGLEYDGPGCAQFLLGRNGPVFLECNPRLNVTVEHAIHCGVDFPGLALEARLDPDRAALRRPSPYREGIDMHFLLGDLEGSLQAWANKKAGLGRVLVWQLQALKDSLTPNRSAIASWRDPRPALVLSGHLLSVTGRRITGKNRRKLETGDT